jgi:transcriptional regulator with XRE-family HTH domain
MPRSARRKPHRLAEKLLWIRTSLGLSQNEMRGRLGLPDVILQGSISGYELGTRLPPWDVLLEYARVAGVCLDVLVDDRLDLPKQLPAKPRHRGVV